MAEQNNKTKQQELNKLQMVRREKLADLQAAGKDPFVITKYDVQQHSADVKEMYTAHEAELLAGRQTPSVEDLEEREMEVNVNETLAAGYVKALKELSERFGLKDDISAVTLSRYPDVITLHKASEDEERIWNAVKTVAETAVSKFIEMRETEGSKLRGDILSRADYIIECVEFIEGRSPETVREYNEKLKQRMKELLGDAAVDEQRLLNEAAIYADKIAVDEETVRLRSHISQLREFMNSSEAIGRKLDFLVQEINREANTIGSKAQDVDIAKKVIAIKAEVEKIREQVQNIE